MAMRVDSGGYRNMEAAELCIPYNRAFRYGTRTSVLSHHIGKWTMLGENSEDLPTV